VRTVHAQTKSTNREPPDCDCSTESGADFDRFESHTGVVAGQKRVEDARGRAFAPATPNFRAQSKDNRGGRDKPGHDPEQMAGASTQPESVPSNFFREHWVANLIHAH
jgi:hypothetical protein